MKARGDRGAVTVLELVLVVPALLAMLVFVVLCGRMGRTAQIVRGVAAAAARAASLERTPEAAVTAAGAASVAADADLRCDPPFVRFAADGGVDTVSVTVRCSASLAGLALIPIGGTKTFDATATEALDAHRGG